MNYEACLISYITLASNLFVLKQELELGRVSLRLLFGVKVGLAVRCRIVALRHWHCLNLALA